jgi:predicted esterase YcpF (UPF0227 family)
MIVYLHGFASTGTSPKVDALRERFGVDQVVSPDLPFNPAEVFRIINATVTAFLRTRNEGEKLVFVGTSLGAFYANFFGALYDCPVVLVNPSAYPSETLKARLGSNKNYVTGDEFLVSVAHLEDLDQMRKYVDNNYSGQLVNLFLAKDDDVIPYEAALESFKFPAFIKVTEDGGHRFSEHWGMVVDRVEEILKG